MHALLLFFASLFHHPQQQPPKPSMEVARFVQQALTTVASYEDGSVNHALEVQLIAPINSDIAELEQSPYLDEHSAALMLRITDELSDLKSYDKELNEENYI